MIKILKRVHYQSLEKNAQTFDNIYFIDNIVFYILSGIYKKDLKEPKIKEKFKNYKINI